MDNTQKYCIVGAGSSGIAAGKNLKARGIPFDIIEREDEVGGQWYYGTPSSSVYQSTHLISSKPLTEYTDYPMPDAYPDFPHHRLVCAYLRDYARHFDLYPHIEFKRSVERIERADDEWDVTLDGGETRRYRGVIIANGHLSHPKWPDYPGEFNGSIIHSADYKTPDVLRGQRVLIVGAGNSGCDIAVESAQNAAATFHSVRRGYYYVPKYGFFGKPVDQTAEMLHNLRLPLWLRRLFGTLLLKAIVGNPQDYGLPKPDHRLFEAHPIVNSQLLYYLKHGDIQHKPDVAELCGDRVRFVDDSSEAIDVIVYATGYQIHFPFIDRDHLNWHNGRPRLYLNVFHPTYDNLFVAGLIQPDSGQFGLVDYQSQAIAAFIHAQSHDAVKADRLRAAKSRDLPDLGRGIQYLDSSRHYLEVEHYGYRKHLKRVIKWLT